MNSQIPQPGSVVRAITTIGTNIPRAVYATVLNIGMQSEADLGEHGEPSLSLVCLDKVNPTALGKVDWHLQFSRHGGVRHASHEDVLAGLVGIYWIDVLPPAGAPIDLDDLDLPDAPLAPVVEQSRPQLMGSGSHLGAVEAPALTAGPDVPKIDHVNLQGIGDNVPANSEVEVNGAMVPVTNLKPGDVLDHFQLRVTGVEEANDTMTVSTEPVTPPVTSTQPSAADLDTAAAEANAKAATAAAAQ